MPARRVPVTLHIDLVCPFCYVAAAPYGRLFADGAIDLALSPFEIHPGTPAAGVPLASFGKAKVDAVYREVKWVAGEVGLTIAAPERLPNSRLALEALLAARAALGNAGAVEFAAKAFQAYFRDGLDLGKEEVLRACLQAAGIGRGAQDECLFGRKQGPAVDEARRQAEDALVTAVPAASVAGFPVIGFRPYKEIRTLVDRAAAKM